MIGKGSTLIWGLGFTVLVHGALLLGLAGDPPRKPRRPRPVRVRLVARARPPRPRPPALKPPTPAKPKPLPPAPPKPALTKRAVPRRPARKAVARKPRRAPPPPAAPKPPTPPPVAKPTPVPPPAPRQVPTPTLPPAPANARAVTRAVPASPVRPRYSYSVDMEATVPGGTGRQGSSGTAGAQGAGTAPGGTGGPGGLRGGRAGSGGSRAPGRGTKPVDAATVTRLPRLVSRPSDEEMREAYPEPARRKGLDANVRLKILVDDKGRVARARVTRRAGDGFDAVALRLVRRHRFEPARKGSRPVPVWIPWTYKFRLGG